MPQLAEQLAVKVDEPSGHIVDGEGEAEIVGFGLTVTVAVAVPVQPLRLVPVTVYVVVDEGEAFTVDPVVALSPVEGDQV